jgi:hypothetical protein
MITIFIGNDINISCLTWSKNCNFEMPRAAAAAYTPVSGGGGGGGREREEICGIVT